MNSIQLFSLGNAEALTRGLITSGQIEAGACEIRNFPDGESYVRVISDCSGRDTAILCPLSPPDRWIVPLLFLAATLRELGARSVGLAAPYLPYMRQDQRFKPGEAVGSRLFAELLSASIDWLVTVDPHLHRYHSLAQVYRVPHRVVQAAPLLSNWIRDNVARPLLVGPDAESEQWVAAVARSVGAPFVVLGKVRLGDREVAISGPDLGRWTDHTPVLLDDMVSTAHTLIEAAKFLRGAGLRAPVCVAVHGLFVEAAEQRLRETGVERIATTNSVAHASNSIDLGAPIAEAMLALANELTSSRQQENP